MTRSSADLFVHTMVKGARPVIAHLSRIAGPIVKVMIQLQDSWTKFVLISCMIRVVIEIKLKRITQVTAMKTPST